MADKVELFGEVGNNETTDELGGADTVRVAPDSLNDFEDTFERLKAIVTELEREDVKLGEMVRFFEEGVMLIKRCDAYLKEARERVGKYIERGDDGRWIIKGLTDDEK
jgi:exodeoxyribonuclease VII small subunit